MLTVKIGDKVFKVTAEELKAISTPDLIILYNHVTGKSIKGFHTRKRGEAQVLAAVAKNGETPVGTTKVGTTKVDRVRKPRTKGVSRLPANFDPQHFKIHVKVAENPKRHGTNAETIFGILQRYDGKLVSEFVEKTNARIIELGARPMGEIAYCLKKGFVELIHV